MYAQFVLLSLQCSIKHVILFCKNEFDRYGVHVIVHSIEITVPPSLIGKLLHSAETVIFFVAIRKTTKLTHICGSRQDGWGPRLGLASQLWL